MRLRRTDAAAAAATTVMLLTSADMIAFGGALMSALLWCVVCVGAAFLALPLVGTRGDARLRRRGAEHAAGLLVMALMWVSMLDTGGASASTSSPSDPVSATAHAGHATIGLDGALWAAAIAAVLLCGLSVHGRRGHAQTGDGWWPSLAQWGHPLMHLGMASMAGAMLAASW